MFYQKLLHIRKHLFRQRLALGDSRVEDYYYEVNINIYPVPSMQQRPINDLFLGIERALSYTCIGILIHKII